MKTRKSLLILLSLTMLSVSCNLPFRKTGPAGVIKTVNGGVDWQFSNALKDSNNSNLSSLNISRMMFDPKNRETLFAGSYSGGLYKSEDSAASWSRILSRIFVFDFAIDSQDSKVIYVAGFYDDFGKILKTKDGGSTWEEVYNEGSGDNVVRALALNPSVPNEMIAGTSSGNIIKSSDSGVSWKLVKTFDDRVNRILWQNNSIYVLLRGGGLMKSSNFGDSFEDLTSSLNQSFRSGAVLNNTGNIDSFNQIFVDQANPGLIYLATSRGLYKSTDEGRTWNMIVLPLKPEDNLVRAVAVARSGSNIVYASVGSTIYKSTDGANTWQTQSIATNGFVNYILIDPQLAQIAYAGIYLAQ